MAEAPAIAPAAPEAPAPVAAAPVAAPAAVEAAAPAAEAPASYEAILAPEEPAAAEAHTPAEAAADTGSAEKPAGEPATAEGEKPAAEAAAEKPAEPAAPTYTDFKIPEGLTVPEERLTEFTSVLAKNGLSQEAGQELLDLHANTLKQATEAMTQNQRDVFDKTRQNWREDFYKTAGNRSNTIIEDAKFAIKESFRDPKDRAEFYQMLNFTGAGDHKGFLYSYAALGRRLRERGAPAAAAPPKGQPMRPADRRYSRSTNGART